MSIKNLWGSIPVTENIRTPYAVLLEQASLLENMTEGLLIGKVIKNAEDDKFRYDLSIVAPALNNYHYNVTAVIHGIELYPLHLLSSDGSFIECETEKAFESRLENTLSSELVRRVIAGLLAQIRADQGDFAFHAGT
ncbi:MAG: hypothetical protein GY795_04735 [Desulfobacterales bacterium]|nr:hypothetical protein [Desulfobacterales bacterium]